MADLELSLRNFLKDAPRNDDEMHDYADKLGMSPHDLETMVYGIAYKALSGVYFKHGDDPDSKFDPDQLAQGAGIEKEHTDDEDLAVKIAKAHLAEIPDYYSRLKDMEDKAKGDKQESRNFIAMNNYKILPILLKEDEEDDGDPNYPRSIAGRHKRMTSDDHARAAANHKDHAEFYQKKGDPAEAAKHRALADKHNKLAKSKSDPYADFGPHHHANAAVQHFKAADRIKGDDPKKAAAHKREGSRHLKAAHNKWFDSLSDEQKKGYLAAHPKSKLKG